MIDRPTDLFDREQEWQDLSNFAQFRASAPSLGIVYGRRRQGKSYLLRRAVKATGGLHVQALEEGRSAALARVGDAVALQRGLPKGVLQPRDWPEALHLLGSADGQAGPQRRLVVLDEFPYMLAHSPELPSALQQFIDEAGTTSTSGNPGIVVCGSALSVMTGLLTGSRALRGRAQLALVCKPFSLRQARQYWGIADLHLALVLHALIGGTPGYRDLLGDPPESLAGLGEWLARGILNPAHALFREAEYVLAEDPRIADRSLYHSLLDAISRGERTPSRIAGRLGRPEGALRHPLGLLQEAGFVEKTDDVLHQRRAIWTVADPIVRFAHLVLRPNLPQLEDRRALQVWQAAQATFATQILGPHFEHQCRLWVQNCAAEELLHRPVGTVGPATLSDAAGRAQVDLDVVALAPAGSGPQPMPQVVLIGEAKSGGTLRTLADLQRLERARTLVTATGRGDAAGAVLALFSRAGFDEALQRTAAQRRDVALIGLPQLFGEVEQGVASPAV